MWKSVLESWRAPLVDTSAYNDRSRFYPRKAARSSGNLESFIIVRGGLRRSLRIALGPEPGGGFPAPVLA